MQALTRLLLLLLTFSMSLPAFSQITLDNEDVTTPNQMGACQEAQLFLIEVPNNSADTFFNVMLTYDFFEYGEYVASSLAGAIEFDISDNNAPVFLIDTLPPGVREISFLGQADCESIASPDIVQDEIFVSYTGGTFSFDSPQYNITTPVLTFSQVSPLDYTGLPDSNFTITICIKNEGFGPVSELFVSFSHNANLINVLSASAGEVTSLPGANTTTVHISGTDFQSMGDNDALLEADDGAFCLELTIDPFACGSSSFTVTGGWGCGGATCEEISVNGNLMINSLEPDLVAGLKDYAFAQTCEEGFVELFLANVQEQGQFTGAATAKNLVLNPDFGDGANSSCVYFPLYDFQIGDSIISAEMISSGYRLDLTDRMTADPDGPGGLSDADGDGFFDDLAVGDTICLSMAFSFNVACMSECSGINETFRLRAYFENLCGQNGSMLKNFGSPLRYRLTLNSNAQFQVEYEADTIMDANFSFYYSAMGGMECPNATFRIIFELPEVLEVPTNFEPTLGGEVLPWTISGDSLILTLENGPPAGQLQMQFNTVCLPLEMDPTAPCPFLTGDTESYEIKYKVEMTCDPDCSATPVAVRCDSEGPFILACPFPPVGPGGVQIDDFYVTRLTMGFTDESMTEFVDENTPGLLRQRAMPHDTMLFAAAAAVFDNAENLELVIKYYVSDPDAEDWLSFVGGEVVFSDLETGAVVSCDGLTAIMDTINGYHRIIVPITPLFEPGGCLAQWSLSNGDYFISNILLEVTEAVPYPLTQVTGLSAGYSFTWNDLVLSCNARPAILETLHPYENSFIRFDLPVVGCDTVTVIHHLFQNVSGLSGNDPFPYEYRPFALRKRAEFNLPEGWEFVPNSGRVTFEHRPGNVVSGPVETKTVVIPDPIQTTVNGQVQLQFNGPFPGVDLIDFSTLNTFEFDLIPACLSSQAPTAPHTFFYDTYSYAPGSAVGEEDDGNLVAAFLANNLSLNSTNPFPSENGGVASWNFDLNYPGFYGVGAPNVYFDFVLPEGVSALSLIEIIDINTSVVHELLPYGAGAWAQIGDLPTGTQRNFVLSVIGEICEPDTVLVRANFQCHSYPPDPSDPQTDCEVPDLEMPLFIQPNNALVNIILSQVPAGQTPLCEELFYEMQGINFGAGATDLLEVFLVLPSGGGLFMVPGTSEFRLENGTWVPIPDPIFLSGMDTLYWTNLPVPTDGLPGSADSPDNTFYIRFKLKSDCDYDNGSQFIIGTDWLNGCGSRGIAQFAAPPLNLQGAPTDLNEYAATLETSNNAGIFEICNGSNGVIINLLNLPSNHATLPNEFILLTLPAGVIYVDNSTQSILNMDALGEPLISYDGNQQSLRWELPAGVPPGEWMNFRIDLAVEFPELLLCNEAEMVLQIVQAEGIPCVEAPLGYCSIDFVETEVLLPLPLAWPVYEWDAMTASAAMNGQGGEEVTFSGTLKNISQVSATDMSLVEIYIDSNQSGVFEAGEDILLDQLNIDVESLVPGASLSFLTTVNVPDGSTCNGYLLVIDPANNPCICDLSAIFVSPPPLEFLPDSLTMCNGEMPVLGGLSNPDYIYDWSSPNLSDPNMANPLYLPPNLSLGESFTETILVTITRQPGGCTTSDQVMVTTYYVGAELVDTSNYNGYGISCPGYEDGEVTVSGLGGLGSYSYEWGNGTIDSLIEHQPAGTYAVTVTDVSGCTGAISVELNEPPLLVLDMVSSDFQGYGIPCFGDSTGNAEVLITGGVPLAGGGYTILWNNGQTGQSIVNLPTGTYTVTITDANSCTQETSTFLAAPPPMVLSVESTDSPCTTGNNGSISLAVEGGVPPYTAALNGSVSGNLMWTDLAAGDYEILVTDTNGCSEMAVETIVAEVSSFDFLTEDATCNGAADGNICIEPDILYGGSFTVLWSNGQTGTCISNLLAGTYSATITDGNGCEYDEDVIVIQPEALQASFTVIDNQCFGDQAGTISVTVEGGTDPYTYAWNDGEITSFRTELAAGEYILTITDNLGCTSASSVAVIEPPVLQLAAFATDVSCFGSSDGAISVNAFGGSPPYQTTIAGTVSSNHYWPDLSAGNYEAIVTDSNGCTASDQVVVEEPGPILPLVEAVPPLCVGDSNGQIEVEEPQGEGWQYRLDGSNFQDEPLFMGLPAGIYQLSVINSDGCQSDTLVQVPGAGELSAEILAGPDHFSYPVIDLGDSILLQVEAYPWNVSINWIGGEVPCDTCWKNWVQPVQETTYEILVTDENGCEKTALITVRVSREEGIYIPNAFSPNDDGINDLFLVYARPGFVKEILNLQVYNRWGSKVFERSGFSPNDPAYGWDGNFNGQPASLGVFVWWTEVELIDGTVLFKKGDVALVR